MDVKIIGKQIAVLRKEKGIKQDELARHVGVSTQAVSKWENGGVPDTELLPMIADFFGVSVDCLFGRNITDYNDLETALCQKIIDAPYSEQVKLVYDYCRIMEFALFGEYQQDGKLDDNDIDNYTMSEPNAIYSSFLSDNGFTKMALANTRPYFFVAPEPPADDEKFKLDNADYVSFLKDFSDPDLFNTCIMLYKRDTDKAFTPNLLVKKMGVNTEKAMQILAVLKKYHFLHEHKIEMDDEVQIVYNFNHAPAFIPFLIFARELISPPSVYYYYNGGRKTPYLN